VLLGVDVGGTKIALALITNEGEITESYQYQTDPSSPASLIDEIVRFATSTAIDAIGVCVPAVLEPQTDRILWAPNLPGWRNVSLPELLHDHLDDPVFVEYDGHAAVLGEWWAGAAKGYKSVASIIVGTGIGGGFVVDGQLWRGRDRLAGAVGWFTMQGHDGPDHWENLAAGPAVVRRMQALRSAGHPTIMQSDSFTSKDVFDAARSGDALAQQVVQETAEYIGQGMASVVSLTNPEIVVLGGSVGQQGDLLLQTVRSSVCRWAQPAACEDLPIVSSFLGEKAGLLGSAYAAMLRLQE
jgi:glucokinase